MYFFINIAAITHTHLLLVSFVGELDADVVVFPDLRDDRSLAADDLGMKLWIDGHGYLETAQGLKRRRGSRDLKHSNIFTACPHHIQYDL